MIPSFPVAAALALSAAQAFAQPPDLRQHYSFDGQKVVAETAVPYQDLDLASPAGLRALRQRIEAAADTVCGGEARAGDSYQRQAFLVCRDAAIRAAVARAPQPARTRLAALR